MTIEMIRWSRGFDLAQTVFIYVISPNVIIIIIIIIYAYRRKRVQNVHFSRRAAEVVRIYLITRTTLCL